MINLEFSTLIDRPVAQVFAFMSDMTNLPRWQSMIVGIQQTSKGPVGVGATFRMTGEMIGRKMEGDMEITEFVPEQKFGYKGQAGPMSMQASIAFKTVGTGTQVSLSAHGEPGGVFKLAEGVLVNQLKSQMEGNLAKLKAVLEAGA